MTPDFAKALIEFKKRCPMIKMTGLNPHFGNRYATLAAIHSVIDPILTELGMTVIQFPVSPASFDGVNRVGVRTVILHESGEEFAGEFFAPTTKNDAQQTGAAITYLRRYGISAALGIVTDEDDDGNSTIQAPRAEKKQKQPRKAPAMSKKVREILKAEVDHRILLVGTPDNTQAQVLSVVAKALGKTSAIELLDSEFDKAVEIVRAWEPIGGKADA